MQDLSKSIERYGIYLPSSENQEMKMREVPSNVDIGRERCHTDITEKPNFTSYDDNSEKNPRREPKDLCAHFYTPGKGHLYSDVSGSAIERSSVYEVNASEKLDTFFNDRLRVQSECSVQEDLEENPSSFYENIDVLCEEKKSCAIASDVQKCQPSRSPVHQNFNHSRKTMSLGEVCQVMDELNHVQLMICRFESPVQKHANNRGPERKADRARERQVCMNQEPEKRLRDQLPNLREHSNRRSRETGEETANKHQTTSKEESYQHGYNHRRQNPCESEYEGPKTILSPPKVLEGVASQENYKNLVLQQKTPKILEKCKVNHIKNCTACQNINQGRSVCPREWNTYENAQLQQEEKECNAPLRSSSKSPKEDKTFAAQDWVEDTAMNDYMEQPFPSVPSHQIPEQSKVENPSWYVNCDQTLDKNCAVFWRIPEEGAGHEDGLDPTTQPSAAKNNVRVWRIKSEEEPSNRQCQKERICCQASKHRERRSKSMPRPEVYNTLEEASAKLKAENRVQRVTDAFEKRIRRKAKFTVMDFEKKDREKETTAEGSEYRASRCMLQLPRDMPRAGSQAERLEKITEREDTNASTSKQSDMHLSKGQGNTTFKLQYYV